MKEIFGIKIAIIVMGFAGALISLRYSEPMGVMGMLTSIMIGTASAIALTPLAIQALGTVLQLTGPSEYGISFLIGYSAMTGLPLIKRRFLSRVTGEEGQ